jgi:hypothetical protein
VTTQLSYEEVAVDLVDRTAAQVTVSAVRQLVNMSSGYDSIVT